MPGFALWLRSTEAHIGAVQSVAVEVARVVFMWNPEVLVQSPTFTQLRAQVRTRISVVPFVGAGLSIPCGLPGWSAGLLALARESGCEESIDSLLVHGAFEEAASALHDVLGEQEFSARLRRLYGTHHRLAGPVLRIPLLTNGPVITTNFDDVLESVFTAAGTPFAAVSAGVDIGRASGALHQDLTYLLKLHGDLTDPAHRVLTLLEYRHHYETAQRGDGRPRLPKLLEQIFTSRTLLFVGCSLRFDRTLGLLRHVRSDHAAPPQHYAIVEEPSDTAGLRRRTDELAALNVLPGWYPPGRHELVGVILDLLLSPDEVRRGPSVRSRVSETDRLLAIDFGTSISLAATWSDEDRPEYVRDLSASRRIAVPSIVQFRSEYEYSVGGVERDALRTIRNVKRELGTGAPILVGRRRFTAEEIASFVIRSLLLNAEQSLGVRFRRALVSVPANFGMRQTTALIAAFQAAGVEIVRTIGEPCAAALNVRGDQPCTVLVIDLGGGTLDVSIVELDSQIADVLAVSGDDQLGGIDFDLALADLALQSAQVKSSDVSTDQWPIVEAEAERAKVALSSGERATLVLRDIETGDGNLQDIVFSITRKEFAQAVSPLVSRIDQHIDRVLAGFNQAYTSPFNTVMLAGMGTKIAPVFEHVKRRFRDKRIVTTYQGNAVVRGLAAYSGVLSGQEKSLLMIDRPYRDLGILATKVEENVMDLSAFPRVHDLLEPLERGYLRRRPMPVIGPEPPSEVVQLKVGSVPAFFWIAIRVTATDSPSGEIQVVEMDRSGDNRWDTLTRIVVRSDAYLVLRFDYDANRTCLLFIIDGGAGTVRQIQLNHPHRPAGAPWFVERCRRVGLTVLDIEVLTNEG